MWSNAYIRNMDEIESNPKQWYRNYVAKGVKFDAEHSKVVDCVVSLWKRVEKEPFDERKLQILRLVRKFEFSKVLDVAQHKALLDRLPEENQPHRALGDLSHAGWFNDFVCGLHFIKDGALQKQAVDELADAVCAKHKHFPRSSAWAWLERQMQGQRKQWSAPTYKICFPGHTIEQDLLDGKL